MPKFKVWVTEEVTARYNGVDIVADTEEEAYEAAERMRCQGQLGEPQEMVDDVIIDVGTLRHSRK